MRHRYENWVNGLTGDWCVSRQRFFGVPFLSGIRFAGDGSLDYARPITPDESRLPIDPSTDVPDGYTAEQRGKPSGFAGDSDVMDTWATSSLTPQIAGGWLDDPDLFARVFPMDLRPQGHDIIRTWLFTTVLRSHLEHDPLPWAHAALSGFDARSRPQEDVEVEGNVGDARSALLEEHRIRWRAVLVGERATAATGADHRSIPAQMKVGRRLAIKILNAARFALMQAEPRGPITEPLDRGHADGAGRAGRRIDRAASRRTTTRACSNGHREILLGLL